MTPTLTAGIDAVLITPDIDHTTLTVDRLPRTPAQLTCGGCGETRERHWKIRPSACDGFVRPALPEGYAYADTLTRGTHIRRLSRPRHGSELVLAVAPSPVMWAKRMLMAQLETAVGGTPVLAYLTPDVVVAVLPADQPLGS